MFDFGIQELILIFVVVLVVYGPKRMPDIARAIGRGIAEVKRSLECVKTELDTEIKDVKEFKEMSDPIRLKNEIFKNESILRQCEESADLQTKPEPPATDKAGNVKKITKPARRKKSNIKSNTKKSSRSSKGKSGQGRRVKK
jgi:Tat protein translocase TatB subunit